MDSIFNTTIRVIWRTRAILLLLCILGLNLLAAGMANATITYQTPGALAYSAAGGSSVSPAHPASVAAGDLLVLIVGMKPTTANGGSVATPAGWTPITSITGAGGYGATLGTDTGNTNLFAFYKEAVGGESGNLSVALTANNVSWAQIFRLSNTLTSWSVAGATGQDISGGNVSIAFGSNPGVTTGDFILAAMCIPTDVTTPSQFSGQAFTQSGVTYGTDTEISEPDSSSGNGIGGFVVRVPVSSGTGSANPTMTATAGGTTTNVRGPGIFIRIREVNAPPVAGAVTVLPDNGSYTSASPAISAPFTSGQTITCEYTVNGTTWNNATVSGSIPDFTCTANPSGLTGSLTLNMRATSTGGTTTASAITRTVDGAAPVDGTFLLYPGYTENGLIWGAANDGSGSGVDHYDVYFQTGGVIPSCGSGTLIYTGNNLNYTHTGRTSNTQYSYRVCATDRAGLVSTGSYGTLTTTTRPSVVNTCGACHGNPPVDNANRVGGVLGQFPGNHGKHQYSCSTCHIAPTQFGHANGMIEIAPAINGVTGSTYSKGISFAVTNGPFSGGICNNINCHGGGSAIWGGTLQCLDCHNGPNGKRAGVGMQFNGSSHHVQGRAVTSADCFQCHWEANSNGSINSTYHQRTDGAAVDLVVYTAGSRPGSYTAGQTAVQYLISSASGKRAEQAKLNQVCLGCHSDDATGQPFGDGKTPKQYAWDGSSIAARYGDTGTVAWGKYNSTTYSKVTPKDKVTKALSAHGNATANQGGWDLSEKWPNTRAGSVIVLCFDCHNSHGSTVTGTTTSYASATTNGGILKDTVAGQGGYGVTYRPAAGGSPATHNAYNAGAALCFDCHMTDTTGGTPWGYNVFGASQPVMGYFDSIRFGNTTSGAGQRMPYKAQRGSNAGGHFGASSLLTVSASKAIGGLCTPCHDPHGVSPSMANRAYGVPLLKGTYLTSPFREDMATPDNMTYRYMQSSLEGDAPTPAAGVTQQAYSTTRNSKRINENTFGGTGAITETDTVFAGLCLQCHAKTSLTNGTTHTWKSKDRIHESVKGWKTANANDKHKFSCSKCHSSHTSITPRLMVTNCMDSNHRGRVKSVTEALSNSGTGKRGNGSGRFPGTYLAVQTQSPGPDQPRSYAMSCHEGNTGSNTNQLWNTKTPW